MSAVRFVQVRMPDELRLELQRIADKNDRSMHGQILACLRACVASERYPDRTTDPAAGYDAGAPPTST